MLAVLIKTNSRSAAVAKYAMIDRTIFRVSKTNNGIAFVERFPIMLQPFVAGIKGIPQAVLETEPFKANPLGGLAVLNAFDSNNFL